VDSEMVFVSNCCPTQRAADKWESARFQAFSTPQQDSVFEPCPRPAHQQVTRAVSQLDRDKRRSIGKETNKMNTSSVQVQDGVFKRVLLLYGLFMLLSNAAYLLAYYLLPEGFLRGSPMLSTARVVASSDTFWSEMASTFLVNLGVVTALSVILNVLRVKGFSLGYIWPIFLAIQSGVVAGTNSFLLSDLTQVNVRDGMAASLSVGGLEFLGYRLIIASTVSLAAYQFSSWTQLRPTKLKNFRDVRLSRAEVLCLIGGIVLLLVAANIETVRSAGL